MANWLTHFSRELDEFRPAIRPDNAELTITARGQFAASVTRVDLERVRMQSVKESLPRIMHGDPNPSRRAISFLAEGGTSMFSEGSEIAPMNIALHSPARTYSHRLSSAAHWTSMTLSEEDWTNVLVPLLGHDLASQDAPRRITPSLPSLSTLRRLSAAAVYLAEHTPELLKNKQTERALDEELLAAMVACLNVVTPHLATAMRRHHTAIIRRFRKALDESMGKAVYMPELCITIGVSAATLRACCQEHFGLSPKRYLFLRRMNLVRRMLRAHQGSGRTVTDIATQFGFWELGRFAVEYSALFGESPSTTLRQSCALNSISASRGSGSQPEARLLAHPRYSRDAHSVALYEFRQRRSCS